MLVKNFFGLVKMTFGLVDVGYSLPEGQAVKLIFFAPCSFTLSNVRQVIKKSILLSYFHDWGKRKSFCVNRGSLYFRFVNRARDPLYDPP